MALWIKLPKTWARRSTSPIKAGKCTRVRISSGPSSIMRAVGWKGFSENSCADYDGQPPKPLARHRLRASEASFSGYIWGRTTLCRSPSTKGISSEGRPAVNLATGPPRLRSQLLRLSAGQQPARPNAPAAQFQRTRHKQRSYEQNR